MMRTSLLFYGLMVSVALWSGCDSGESTGSGSSLWIKPPAIGSTFTYSNVQLDMLGNELPGSERIFTDSVSDVGLSYFGKSNVMQIIERTEFGSQETRYFNYESNGDISEFMDLGQFTDIEPFWVTYPIQSRRSRTYTIMDTMLGNLDKYTSTVSIGYGGITSMQINGVTVDLIRLDLIAKASLTSHGQTDTFTSTARYYFAPSLGFLAKVDEDASQGVGIPEDNGSRMRLIRYTLQ